MENKYGEQVKQGASDPPSGQIAASLNNETIHSYRKTPGGTNHLTFHGRSAADQDVLNDEWVNVTQLDTKIHSRNNNSEIALINCEDERYELDMLIKSSDAAILKLQDILDNSESSEEDTKQPEPLSANTKAAIRVLYGHSNYAKVLEHIETKPSVAIPVLTRRMKGKNIEWRLAQISRNRDLRGVGSRNYYGSLEHCGTLFKEVEKNELSQNRLLLDIIDPVQSALDRCRDIAREHGYSRPRYFLDNCREKLFRSEADDSGSNIMHLQFGDAGMHFNVFEIIENKMNQEKQKQYLTEFRKFLEVLLGIAIEENQDTARYAMARKNIYANEAIYVALRLYHLLFARVLLGFKLSEDAAREKAQQMNKNRKTGDVFEDSGSGKSAQRQLADCRSETKELVIEQVKCTQRHISDYMKPFALNGSASVAKHDRNPDPGEEIDVDAHIFKNYLNTAKAFVGGKIDAKCYEEFCLVHLGLDSYPLFTVDKIVQRLKTSICNLFREGSRSRSVVALFHKFQDCNAKCKVADGTESKHSPDDEYSHVTSRILHRRTEKKSLNLVINALCDEKVCKIEIKVINDSAKVPNAIMPETEGYNPSGFIAFCKKLDGGDMAEPKNQNKDVERTANESVNEHNTRKRRGVYAANQNGGRKRNVRPWP